MQMVNANNLEAREAFMEGTPALTQATQEERPPALPEIPPDIIVPVFPESQQVALNQLVNRTPRTIKRIPTTRQNRERLAELLTENPLMPNKQLAAHCRMGIGSITYWKTRFFRGEDIISGNRSKCGRKYLGVQYADIILESLTIEHHTLRKTVADCKEYHELDPLIMPKPPSMTAIQRFIHSPIFGNITGSALSWKLLSIRGRSSNTDENKDLRIERVAHLQQRLQQGFLWIAVDETRVEVSTAHSRRSWGPVGHRTYLYHMRQGLKVSLLTAISQNGVEFTLAVAGKVTAEVFTAYIDRLLDTLPVNEKAVLWMDNASIHNSLEEHITGTRHTILKNAPYSPELNPIEIFFGSFKQRLRALQALPNTLDELLLLIAQTIRDTPASEIRSEFEHIRGPVWNKVLHRDDL